MHKFLVENRFLAGSISCSEHSRIRSRQSTEQDFTYVHTTRHNAVTADGRQHILETKRPLTSHTYQLLLRTQSSRDHLAIYKSRYTFLWDDQYYQLDSFDRDRCPPAASGLLLLETFSAKSPGELNFPPFLTIRREVSGEAKYRLFNLATPQADAADSADDFSSETKYTLVSPAADDRASPRKEIQQEPTAVPAQSQLSSISNGQAKQLIG